MRPATLLGVDIGTTGVRAAVFDASGRVLAEAGEACTHETPGPGRVEANPEDWWRAVCSTCKELRSRVALDDVAAIGVTGQAPTAVLVDADGRPTRPAILWLDVRADQQAAALDQALGPGRAEAIGGNRMHAYYLGPKLAWLRAHEPEVLGRSALVLQSHAFVVLRLTGEAACDLSTAMLCAPLFDARRGGWSQEGTQATGIAPALLPRIARAEDVVGAVTRRAAAESGLREGTPVVVGGGDFAASALGAGVVDEGTACLMLGTAGNLLMPLSRPDFDSRLINSHHVGCDRWLALGGTLCGAALAWFRRVCASGADWETLEAEAQAVEPSEMQGLLCLPYLQGERTPVWDENARGLYVGLDLTHGRGHLYRALLEGIALGFRHCLTIAEGRGARFGEVVAANGAGRSPLLRQLLADALGLPLTWSAEGGSGATVAGAAMLAGIGAGVLKGASAAASAWQSGRRGTGSNQSAIRHQPDPAASERLYELFVRRIGLYGAVRPFLGK